MEPRLVWTGLESFKIVFLSSNNALFIRLIYVASASSPDNVALHLSDNPSVDIYFCKLVHNSFKIS